MMLEFFSYINERDMVIAFSYSGQSQEILYASEIAKNQHTTVIAVTRKRESVLRDIADICLFVPDKEAVMRIGAFTSLQTSIMMPNLIYMGVIQENLEQKEQFGRTLGWSKEYGSHTLYYTGFTGTSLLMDLEQNPGLVLLTNRIHPSRENERFLEERREINKRFLNLL